MSSSFFTILLFVAVCSCAQTKSIVVNAYGFYEIRSPGNIPVDDNGNSLYNGPDTTYTVYCETSTKNIVWTAAWKGGRSYSAIPVLLPNKVHNAGIAKKNSEKVIIRTTDKNVLWRIELVPDINETKPPKSYKDRGILLHGKSGTQPLYRVVTGSSQLITHDAY